MPADSLLVTVPEEPYAAGLVDLDGVEVLTWDMSGPHPRQDEIRLAVPPYQTRLALGDRLRGLRGLEVVQLLTAGYEHLLADVPGDVTLCNAAGVHDASTAELAVALTLASMRRIPEFHAAQADSAWAEAGIWPALADRRVLLLGYGQIGRSIARRLLPFEVSITAVASRPRPGDDLVEWVHGIDELPDLMATHDVLIVIVPLTDLTKGLVDRDLLERMPDGGIVVNVARGPVVVTDDLRAECASGRLRAALDVTDPEPLPPDHPLWTTPGVLITPHVGGATTAMLPRAQRLLRAQVAALRDGRSLMNIVRSGAVPA
jgi:phosphoglycerate dehydrogenase-like enzyme